MITITDNAKLHIKQVLISKPDMVPLLSLKHGGCSGNILVISLRDLDSCSGLPTEDIGNLRIYVDESAKQYADKDELVIDVKMGLEKHIIVRNVTASNKCKCGKSFGA